MNLSNRVNVIFSQVTCVSYLPEPRLVVSLGGKTHVMSKVKLTNGEDTVMTLEIVARSPKATSSPWNMSDTSATLKAYTPCDRW